ncbi:MAG: hypothetical protein HZC44_04610, partial [Geobacter sp.]|nr:hypothetical protein [Geobacter sp.]
TGKKYTVKVSASGYIGKSYTIGSAPWTQTLNIALTPQATKGSLTSTVVDATTAQPLAGVAVTLVSDPSITATTGSTGSFTFAAVPKGIQQAPLVLDGYVTRTLTIAITAGAVNNTGVIPLSQTPLTAVVQGTVRNGVTNAPFAGVEVQTSGTGTLQTLTATDGGYTLNDVLPGVVTVAATAVTQPAFYGARFTGQLEPGGILVFSPTLSTLPPATVDVTVQTDKADYLKGETVGIAVNLLNNLSDENPATLYVKVIDPSGSIVYDTSRAVTLPGDGGALQEASFVLPDTAQGGIYKVVATTYYPTGTITGTGMRSFRVATSRISITPVLPPLLSVGDTTISFTLANVGDLAVAAGNFGVALKEPGGDVVATAAQGFSLGLGESTTLTFTLAVPPLKFGSYTLSYTESDETKSAETTDMALPNSVAIMPFFDKPTYRIRETANLQVNLNNTGTFALESMAGTGIAVTLSVPDAAYAETKTLSLIPSPFGGTETAGGSILLYGFAIPETVTAGLHAATVTVTLPSGSATVQTAQLAIPEPSLSLTLPQTAYLAGETVSPVLTNSGGVDTPVQYTLELFDVRSARIADKSATESILADADLPLALPIPAGAADGGYTLVVNYKDTKTGKTEIVRKPLAITGTKGTLSVRTDKQAYLTTEGITALSTVANTGTALPNGNLHLQVSTAAGSQQQKVWTSQFDFQQGTRNGVETTV